MTLTNDPLDNQYTTKPLSLTNSYLVDKPVTINRNRIIIVYCNNVTLDLVSRTAEFIINTLCRVINNRLVIILTLQSSCVCAPVVLQNVPCGQGLGSERQLVQL